jgi:Domain of unknown function (DUF3943)
MRHVVLLVPTLFTIMFMSDVPVIMAGDQVIRWAPEQKSKLERMGQPTHRPGDAAPVPVDVDAPLETGMDLSSWRPHEGPEPFSHMFATPTVMHVGLAETSLTEDRLLVEDDPNVVADGSAVPNAVLRDWRGLGRDTASFVGYEAVAAGVGYLLPEHVTQWTATQRRISLQRWWENVRNPKWDPDRWYFNYLGHPYFGAITYIRARERRFGVLGGFGYAALISGLYEYGIEALFERPSYQDLFVTPVGGLLLGALLFDPVREHIRRKAARRWYDHVALALTDPLEVSNRLVERLGGRQTEIRVQWYVPALASSVPSNEPTARSLNRPQEQHRQSPGIGIEFVFAGRKRSTQLPW